MWESLMAIGCGMSHITRWKKEYKVAKTTVSNFLPARRYASAGRRVRPSVRPDVCHTPVLCLAERKQECEMYTFW